MTHHTPTAAVLLDIDGTLLDSNDAHAASWVEILRRHDKPVAYERIRALIGKGADKLLPEVLGIAADDPLIEQLGDERKQLFLAQYLPSLRPTPGARALLERMKADGLTLVVATSSSQAELQALLRQAGIDDLIAEATTSDDAGHSKPDPDIIEVAVERSGVAAAATMMLGDTPYDIQAATAAGVDTVALRCGGWDDAALAGAVAVYDDPPDLLRRWDESPIVRRRRPAG